MLKNKLKRMIAGSMAGMALLMSSVLFTPVALAGPFDASKSSACAGVELRDGASCGSISGSSLHNTLKLVINILSFIAGFAAVIMIIVAGFRYITSGGDSGKVSGAKDALLYAIIGLVIVGVAQFIVKFVIAKAQ